LGVPLSKRYDRRLSDQETKDFPLQQLVETTIAGSELFGRGPEYSATAGGV